MRVIDEALNTRDRLVMDHVGLVRVMAQRLGQRLPSQVEIADLISVGVLGYISDRIIVWGGNRTLRWSQGMYETR